jgi:hypothetical protein
MNQQKICYIFQGRQFSIFPSMIPRTYLTHLVNSLSNNNFIDTSSVIINDSYQSSAYLSNILKKQFRDIKTIKKRKTISPEIYVKALKKLKFLSSMIYVTETFDESKENQDFLDCIKNNNIIPKVLVAKGFRNMIDKNDYEWFTNLPQEKITIHDDLEGLLKNPPSIETLKVDRILQRRDNSDQYFDPSSFIKKTI